MSVNEELLSKTEVLGDEEALRQGRTYVVKTQAEDSVHAMLERDVL